MSLDDKKPIIVKKVRKATHAHHGGAWKIAYADFVTAMMAFFLLMWLLGSTTKAERQGIADYFQNPWKVSLMGGSGAGDATSVLKGGGEDLTRSTGQVKKTNNGRRRIVTRVAEQDRGDLSSLGRRLRQLIDASPLLRQFKNQLRIDLTSEGLRVQIVDSENRPMFASGSDVMEPYARQILQQIVPVIDKLPNRISITGHTDATPYAPNPRGYTNWELSADRANAARRAMVQAGLAPGKVVRVTGLAASVPLERADPKAPVNRRISIIVLNKKAEAALLGRADADLNVGQGHAAVHRAASPSPGRGRTSDRRAAVAPTRAHGTLNPIRPQLAPPAGLRP